MGCSRIVKVANLLAVLCIICQVETTLTNRRRRSRTAAVSAYAGGSNNNRSSPHRNSKLKSHQIAGVWRLTATASFLPRAAAPTSEGLENGRRRRRPKIDDEVGEEEAHEALIRLNEDGSFAYCGNLDRAPGDEEASAEEVVATTCTNDVSSSKAGDPPSDNAGGCSTSGGILGVGILNGMWEFRDGTLTLATDRPPHADGRKVHDTILVGKVVVAHISERICEESSLLEDDGGDTPALSGVDSQQDKHLAVLDGVVSIGRYMYPRHHPSFFEQPIFRPTPIGEFQLRQVLGVLNTNIGGDAAEKEKVEKYRRQDFYGKKFLIATEPLRPKRGAPKLVWSRREGGYVEENPISDANKPFDIRVMPISFFANDTFCAIGASKILRGRYDISGEENDRLWFQVSLFGAGRSAPGSVYSEGKGLTYDDERFYTGSIEMSSPEGSVKSFGTSGNDSGASKRLFVKGSVMMGSYLSKQQPVGSFTLVEAMEPEFEEEADEDRPESIFE